MSERPINYKPTIVMDGAISASLRQVMQAVFFAALFMLVLGSKALLNWSNNLPIGKISDFTLYLAQTWQDFMSALGLTNFSEAFFNALRWLQSLRW